MRILVISDNHGDREILQTIFSHYRPEVDAIFHCGDSEMTMDDPLFNEVSVVKGNNDFGAAFPDEVDKVVAGEHIFMTHGDLYGVSMSMTRLDLKAREVEANIVLYGHTHRLAAEMVQKRLYVNPGSISLPRGEYASLGGTYAIIETFDDKIAVDFYDRGLNRVSSISQQFTR
ncbi:metallophosphoesterase [Secundilactobacillus folii]|uniref:Phosphoesterase n=1 Tax=Secundilactobacillus folii TaxID=2678357 RepID=A0A7X2XX12_9LACO|nr:metallophosphoesterase [Secundilactobacillus folii]MTV83239.1 YfcE family phosphodiesterase [Secundilactobacillus folii]